MTGTQSSSNSIKPTEGQIKQGANFTEGSIRAHLIKLTSYMFMGFATMTISSLIEIIYLGVLGTAELAAVAFTFPVVMVIQSFAMGLGVGASSIIARTMGAGDREQVRKLVTHTIILSTALLVTLCILGRYFARPIFVLLGAEQEILELILAYMDIWFIAMPTFALSMIGTGLIRAVGNAAMPGIVMMVGSILQVILAPFLIFGWLGLPALGIEGAAWSFLLARVASFTLCYYVIIFREHLITRGMDNFGHSCASVLHVGIPAIATNLILPVSMAIVTRLLAEHGSSVVAGFGVGTRIDSLVAIIVFAIASSVGPVIGQNWGANQFDRVKEAINISNKFALIWGFFAFLIMLFFGEFFIALINDDPEVVDSAHWYLLLVPVSIGFLGMISVSSSSFNAMGKPIPPLIISIGRMFVVYIPMALVFNYFWGYIGIYIATSVSTVLLGIVAWYWNNQSIERAHQQYISLATNNKNLSEKY